MNDVSHMMKKVLIVDDDAGFCSLLTKALQEGNKYQVTSFNNPRAALDDLQKETPDVILLDVRMPEMNGVEFLRQLRNTENGKNIFVIMTTNDSSLDTMSETAELSVRGYIIKANQSLLDIVKMVDRVFEQQ